MHNEQTTIMKQFEKALYNIRKDELKNEMLIIKGRVEAVYKDSKKKGLSDKETQEEIIHKLRDIRFFADKSGYIFVYKYDGTNVLFPIKPQWEGKNLNYLKDKNGVYVIKAVKNGGGIVEYLWPKTKGGEPQKKFSYAVNFEPYGWMMGAVAFGLILLNIFVNIFLIRKNITNPLNDLIARAKNLSSGNGDLTRQLEVVGKDEIAQASEAINVFIEKVRFLITDAKNLSNENSSISHELSITSLSVGNLLEESTEESTTVVNNTTEQATKINEEMVSSIDEAKVSKSDLEEANGLSIQNARSVEEIASAAEHMNRMTETLNNKLSEFRT